jgi:hypothetical protein
MVIRAREGCPYVFVGSEGTRYCSAECQEIERREREAARKLRRRLDAGAALRTQGRPSNSSAKPTVS